MIWLVSYPRSGNTFFRNILFHVYGLDSKAFYLENERLSSVDESVPVTKTHHLPEDTPIMADDTIVYLIRDGRDSIVSMAYQMANITEPGSNVNENIYSLLLKQDSSLFGGWSGHVTSWKARAHVLIRFEDLISNPLLEVEKLRAYVALPDPDSSKLPTFESQKSGKAKFHGKDAALFFNKGEIGGWKKSLTEPQLNLLYKVHGQELSANGYEESPVSTSGNLVYELAYIRQRFRIMMKSVLGKFYQSFKRSA